MRREYGFFHEEERSYSRVNPFAFHFIFLGFSGTVHSVIILPTSPLRAHLGSSSWLGARNLHKGTSIFFKQINSEFVHFGVNSAIVLRKPYKTVYN